MLSVRPIAIDADGRVSAADFAAVSPWWTARGGHSPTREMLPSCGAMVTATGVPIAAAFMYLDATGSGVAWLAWMATNPAANDYTRGCAISQLVGFLGAHAESENYWLMTATYHHPSLVADLKSRGWSVGDTGMTQLFKQI